MKFPGTRIARSTAVVLLGGLMGIVSRAQADVTIDATDFTVGATAGGNAVVSNWVGSPFTITAPVLVGAAPGGATGFGNNTVIISNFTITANNPSNIGNGTGNNVVTMLPNTTWNLNGNTLSIGTAGSGNLLTINGGTVTTTASGEAVFGSGGSGNSLVITNGGYFGTLNSSYTVYANNAGYDSVLMTGSGSIWTNAGQLFDLVGPGGNHITVANGGLLVSANEFDIGFNTPTNTLLVTGTGSTVRVLSGGTYVGANGGSDGNLLVVSNGANVVTQAINVGANANRNTLIVTGSGSVLSNLLGNLIVGGSSAASNSLVVSQGGWLYNGGLLTIGNAGSAFANGATVTDAGSVLTNTGDLVLGNFLLAPGDSSLTVTNGGTVFAGTAYVGGNQFNDALDSQLTVTDPGSLLQVSAVHLGGGAAGGNSNTVLVRNGGVLEANSLTIQSGSTANSISNNGGVYQFTTAAPTITPNSGTIAINNGTISFRAINNADVTANQGVGALSGIQFAGANTFMLNAASNTSAVANQSYTFQQVAGNPSNYANLAMVNGQTAYGNGNLTIGATGTMLVSNTIASISGNFLNQGNVSVVSATANFANPVQNAGGLALQQGTVIAALTNASTGTIQGNGTIIGNANSFGTISPGFGIGTLTFNGNLSLTNTSVTLMELAANGSNDVINVSSTFAYGGTLTVTNITGFGFADGQSYQLFNFAGQTGDFSATNLPGLTAGLSWDTSHLDSSGLLVVIPEPSTVGLLIGGILFVGVMCRRRVRC